MPDNEEGAVPPESQLPPGPGMGVGVPMPGLGYVDPFVPLQVAQEMMQIGPKTMQGLIRDHGFPVYRVGRKTFVSTALLARWLAFGPEHVQGVQTVSSAAGTESAGDAKLKVAVGVSQKVGLPQYGSAEANLHISGLTEDTTEEEIEAVLDTARLAWGQMRARLQEKIRSAYNEELNKRADALGGR